MDALAWRVEEACRNAWPAPREIHLGGWLLRAADGPTRRTSAVNPLPGPRAAPVEAVEACERVFAGLGRQALFRVVSLAPELDPELERRGYRAEGASLTLVAGLADGAVPDPAVRLAPAPDADWLALRARLNASDAEAERAYRVMHGTIILPRACALLSQDGAPVAQAYAVLDRDLAVIESVGTLPAARGQGHARRVVSALIAWGRARGAARACLQVMADNRPARALYAGFGFDQEVSRYHYRRALSGPGIQGDHPLGRVSGRSPE